MYEQADQITEIANFLAPWGREITLSESAYESGLRMMHLRIRENKRFTDLDLDADTAETWGRLMLDWAEAARAKMAEAEADKTGD